MKLGRVIFICLAFFALLCVCFKLFSKEDGQVTGDESEAAYLHEEKPLNYEGVKAMWLSQYDMLDVYQKNGSQRDRNEFCELISVMLENCKSIGINTVIVQVRPNGDSMYPSEYFAPSSYVVGSYGAELSYDPLEAIVQEAHKRDLSVHAWVNPMRAMKENEISDTDKNLPLLRWWSDASAKELYLPSVNGRIYLNVAYPEVRELIVSGVREILKNYSVDGIHLDDYFYPTVDESFDSEAYAKYGKGMSLGDFRRSNVNLLVSSLYSAVKSKDESILFGISPAGNIEKNYSELYADVYTWCASDGYVDYICPQLYFGFEHETCAFDTLLEKWNETVKADSVDLWVGLSLSKAADASNGIGDRWAGELGFDEWVRRTDILKRSLECVEAFPKCVGVSFFSYQFFWDAVTSEENLDCKKEKDNFLPMLKLIE